MENLIDKLTISQLHALSIYLPNPSDRDVGEVHEMPMPLSNEIASQLKPGGIENWLRKAVKFTIKEFNDKDKIVKKWVFNGEVIY